MAMMISILPVAFFAFCGLAGAAMLGWLLHDMLPVVLDGDARRPAAASAPHWSPQPPRPAIPSFADLAPRLRATLRPVLLRGPTVSQRGALRAAA